MRIIRMLITFLLLFIVTTIGIIIYCNHTINASAKGKLYTDTKDIPYNKVGLLLGTSKFLGKGYINPYYKYRIEAAIRLYRAGKVKYIIVSGDNGRKEYNEPVEMQRDLLKGGVDSSHIFLDYAGFRTFDSVVRLKDIFGQDSVTMISQLFHNQRAIYIASREGIVAIGYNATDLNKEAGFRTQLREKFARVKVFLDYFFGKKPKYLGQKVFIP